MIVYTVHENRDAASSEDRILLVKQGFNWLCLIAPAIWFIWRGHWIGLLAFFGGAVVLSGLFWLTGIPDAAGTIVMAGYQLALAFEANNWRRFALERRGYALIDVIAGRNLAEAEWRYFDTHESAGEAGGPSETPRPRSSFARPVRDFLRQPLERPGTP